MSFTKTEVDQVIARNIVTFKQDIVGTNSIAISAGTPARFVIDGLARNYSESPAYFTDRWDTTNHLMTAITEVDGPVAKAEISFIWTPTASSEGVAYVRAYVNDATPKLLSTQQIQYKGALATPKGVSIAWYWGSETGYDIKNDGIYFTLEFEHAGTVSTPALLIYHTQ